MGADNETRLVQKANALIPPGRKVSLYLLVCNYIINQLSVIKRFSL